MTFKKLIRAGLAVLAALAVARVADRPDAGADSCTGGAPLRHPPRRLSVNKGDTAWMLTVDGARSADDHPGPRAVLRRPGPHQEHALGAHARVLHGVHRHRDLGDLRLQPRLHRRLALHRRLRQDLPEGRDHRLEGGDLLGRRHHPRARLRLLPDDLRRDHAGADRRRLRRAHEVLGGGAVHPALGDASSISRSPTWSGTGPVRTRSTPPPRRLAAATDAAAKTAAQAALDAVMADAGQVFLWGAIDFAGGTVVHINCRHRRPGRRAHRRQAHRLRQGADAAALAGA